MRVAERHLAGRGVLDDGPTGRGSRAGLFVDDLGVVVHPEDLVDKHHSGIVATDVGTLPAVVDHVALRHGAHR